MKYKCEKCNQSFKKAHLKIVKIFRVCQNCYLDPTLQNLIANADFHNSELENIYIKMHQIIHPELWPKGIGENHA